MRGSRAVGAVECRTATVSGPPAAWRSFIASLSGIGDDEQADALVIPRGQTGLVLVLGIGLGLLGTLLPAALVGCAPLTSNAALRE